MNTPITTGLKRSSRRVLCAAALATVYALILIGLAAGVLVEFITGSGAIGHKHLTGIGAAGVVEVSAFLAAGATLLISGAVRLVVTRRRPLLVSPLGVLAGVGCIGEITDMLGNASIASDVIGAAIIALALIPIALVARP